MAHNPLAQGLESHETAEPLVVFIFGVTGDLTRSKLLPALYSLFLNGRLSQLRIVGFARRDWSDEFLREKAASMIESMPGSDEQRNRFLSTLTYLRSTFEDDEGYKKIPEYAKGFANRLYYLSTPPSSYADVIGRLGEHGLAAEEGGYTRIIVEKPFGRDLASARELNALLLSHFEERQVYRIDHYLGKETVQNLMMLRFGNGIFEPVWNRRYVDHVQITVAEDLGVETRGAFYEEAGASRDILQNHMLQLLSLVAMEPPINFEADALRDEKVRVLRAIDTEWTPDRIHADVVRGQYDAGWVADRKVSGYRDEPKVAPGSSVETYVALHLEVENWRWAGVPFYLRTGKHLPRRATEIAIQFNRPPLTLFRDSASDPEPNMLAMRIQPDEGILLRFAAKVPELGLDVRSVNMDFTYGSTFLSDAPEAYETLLLDAMLGDASLFTRADEVEAAWSLVTPLNEMWREWGAGGGSDKGKGRTGTKRAAFGRLDGSLQPYQAGTWGPEAADRLLQRDGRRWRRL